MGEGRSLPETLYLFGWTIKETPRSRLLVTFYFEKVNFTAMIAPSDCLP
jgi:hypothetical protein